MPATLNRPASSLAPAAAPFAVAGLSTGERREKWHRGHRFMLHVGDVIYLMAAAYLASSPRATFLLTAAWFIFGALRPRP